MLEKYIEEIKNVANQCNEDPTEIIELVKRRYDLGIEAGLSEEEIINMLPKIDDFFKKCENINNEVGLKLLQVEGIIDGDLYIEVSDNPGISYYIDEAITAFYKVTSNDEELIIKQNHNFKLLRKGKGDIKIFINKDLFIEEVRLGAVAADIHCDYIFNCNKLSLSTVSGDVFGNSFNASKSTNINIVSGDVLIDKLNTGDVKISTVSGDLTIKNIKANDVKASTISGDVIVNGSVEMFRGSSVSGECILNSTKTILTVGDRFKNLGKRFKK